MSEKTKWEMDMESINGKKSSIPGGIDTKKIEKTPKLYDGIGNVNRRNLYVLPDGQGLW